MSKMHLTDHGYDIYLHACFLLRIIDAVWLENET